MPSLSLVAIVGGECGWVNLPRVLFLRGTCQPAFSQHSPCIFRTNLDQQLSSQDVVPLAADAWGTRIEMFGQSWTARRRTHLQPDSGRKGARDAVQPVAVDAADPWLVKP